MRQLNGEQVMALLCVQKGNNYRRIDLTGNEIIRNYKDKLRIFLILYYFSDNFSDSEFPSRKKIFKSEVKIQKIDFLLRNPDYLAYELLKIVENNVVEKQKIKEEVQSIFNNNEPQIRRLEMERFFFGAYEDIDDIIAFLVAIEFIDFHSKKSTSMRAIEKEYYITEIAVNKMQNDFEAYDSFQWYANRCALIKKYFGNLTGTELKISQYKISEYKNTSYNDYIGSIEDQVLNKFRNIYGESL